MAGLSAAGAAAGTAVMPGIGTAIGGVLGALGDSFLGGGSAQQAAPQNATAAVYGSGLDGSNWNVNFSGVQSATSSADKSGSLGAVGTPATIGASGGFQLGSIPVVVWVALAAVVVWKSRSKK